MDDNHRFDSLRDTIAALQEGSLEAFDVLYYKYVGKVHNFILKISGDSALSEDITQEVFIKLWHRREELDPARNIESWLFVCARNLFLNELRRRRQGAVFAAETQKTAAPSENNTLSYDAPRVAENGEYTSSFRTIATQHIFLVCASSATSTLEIEVEDSFGNVYRETMQRPRAFVIE